MIIESLELKNYRNYDTLGLSLSEKVNLFYGDNAQGKTNILESIYMAATSKSHRSAKDKDIVFFGREEAHIKLLVRKNDTPVRIDMHLKKNKAKGVALNSIPIHKVSELFGVCNVVFFSPEDLGIIKRSPAERRKFIDMELCQLDRLYVYALVNYNKILNQRNKLLKDVFLRKDLLETLDVWDIQLVKYGTEVIRRRENFIKKLNTIMKKIHFGISGEKESLYISYDRDVLIENFEKELLKSRDTDLKYKTTNVGPHRDDISFYINDIDVKRFGSQGQQRSVALSLKLAEIEMVKEVVKEYPILLLDDVLSELDIHRQSQLLSSIKHIQTLITCTGLEDVINKNLEIDRIIRVIDGSIEIEK